MDYRPVGDDGDVFPTHMMSKTDHQNDVTTTGGTFRVEYDWTDPDSISNAIIEAVATCAGVGVLDLDPLNDVVDPDSLNALFSPRSDGTPRHGISVQFTFNGYVVTVDSEGTIEAWQV